MVKHLNPTIAEALNGEAGQKQDYARELVCAQDRDLLNLKQPFGWKDAPVSWDDLTLEEFALVA